ncbi:MAG TPA: Gfo/Idh/MocA family oxidoreductase [Flavobacteriales bacterium]|nr:Gfo/Idh/MocA family oxidoreductase [Flavobacteriales bacterium]HIB78598.1 Gfo/Idh/MocA family oxidoreductase [Flavobacteriales bacterium]HIN42321.1 Gfo/Idh/MocA family oxidoreductase [Flavobacteriales bacterium]HIO15878.1 Gfo/Idh/MocA family oxidoreductase [Flavobacteriales bacterium]
MNTSSSNPVTFAILGFGHIGKRHSKAIIAHPNATLTAIADIEPVSVEGVIIHKSLDSLLASPQLPEVVCVCTPNGLHAAQTISILNAGCDVVLEKPIALSSSDARRIEEVSIATGKNVFCVMQNRFAPPSVWLKTLVDSGKLGEIRQVHVQCFWNRDDDYYSASPWRGTLELDGGPLFTQFSHFIDVMYWIFGSISNPRAIFRNQAHSHNTQFEDSGQISFDLLNQPSAWGSFTFSTALAHSNFESSLTLMAENGTIRIAGQYMEKVVYCDVSNYEMPDLASPAPPNDYGSYKGSASNHHHVMANVIDVLRYGASIATPISEGIDVVEIIEAMHNSGPRP